MGKPVWMRFFMLKLTTASLLADSMVIPGFAQTPAPANANHSPAALNAPAAHDIVGNTIITLIEANQ
jgi:hypothetical protein